MRLRNLRLLPALLVALPAPGLAADAVVGTGSPGSCTEAALDAGLATVGGSGGTLSFNCGPNPHAIVVTSEKELGPVITIDGGGLITLSGGLATRIFRILEPGNVTLSDLVLTHGNAAPGGAIWGPGSVPSAMQLVLNRVTIENSISALWGGAIAGNHLDLYLNDSHIRDNQATGGGGGINLNPGKLTSYAGSSITGNTAGGDGGGVEAWSAQASFSDTRIENNQATGAGGGVSLRDAVVAQFYRATVRSNTAATGAGLFAWGTSDVTITSSHVSGNYTQLLGGGGGLLIDIGAEVQVNGSTFAHNAAGSGAGILNRGVLYLINSTVAHNDARSHPGVTNGGTASILHTTIANNIALHPGEGAGLFNSLGSSLEIYTSLLSGNRVQGGATNSQCEFETAPTGFAFNLWSDTSCGTAGTNGNQPNTNPGLAGLAKTCTGLSAEIVPTMALAATSPAVDAATCIGGLGDLDQRGVARPQGLACDIGAVEYQIGDCFPLFADDLELGNTNAWSSPRDRQPLRRRPGQSAHRPDGVGPVATDQQRTARCRALEFLLAHIRIRRSTGAWRN